MTANGFNGDHSKPEFFLNGEKVGTTYKEYETACNALKQKAHEREFTVAIPGAKYVGMNVGIHEGQATAVVLHADGEHATVGAVHVAIIDGALHVAIEAEPEMEVCTVPVVRRPRWRFYDYWRFDKDKHDNFIRPESEWPKEGE